MKKLFSILAVSTLALGLPTVLYSADKKAKPAPEKPVDAGKEPAGKPAEKPADAAKPAAEGAKAIPMNSRADSIDVAGKTFTMKRKDGVEVKHVLTDKTDIKNGTAAAKLEDIKVGDYVSGLRMKKSDTEYEVVKITKFGPKAEKTEGDAKPAEGAAKPAGDAGAKPADKKK